MTAPDPSLTAVARARPEPIAIVGIGCRFPGGAIDPESFWRLLVGEVDAVTEVPTSRFSLASVYDPRPQTPGRISTRYGAFLDGIELFDAEFFGMTPLEATSVDPQQRLLLETVWEALEDAGIPPERLPRHRAGVYVGIMASDYEDRLQSDPDALNGFALNGSGRYAASGRVSFCLGLNGPSVTVDTACSSSLLAVHLASQSLRLGDCDVAVAGGAHVVLQPHVSISLSQANILAADGHCKFGDASANGFVRGEGAGVVLLKRLRDAIAEGDRIYAVVRGSAVNNDGNSTRSMGRPSRMMQEELLAEVYRTTGVAPNEVDYVEAHGTGTAAGDPAELAALGRVLGMARSADEPLRVGSVKTNIGHTEGASGIAGLIKLALSLHHKTLPRSLHFQNPSPRVSWAELHLQVQTATAPWSSTVSRKGGVNSFGMSGTNVHAVLEEAPLLSSSMRDASTSLRSRSVLPLSAKTRPALQEMARRYSRYLDAQSHTPFQDICHSAGVTRSHFPVRAAVVARSHEEARAKLDSIAGGKGDDARALASTPRVAFVFSGQGGQYAGMGRGLYAASSVFRESFDECAARFAPSLGHSLVDMLLATESAASLDDTAVAQAALFTLEYALASLWRSWGVVPAAVFGHSAGELAALVVAEVLSLSDGVALVAERGRRMQALPRGAMATVQASVERVSREIAPGGAVAIAAVNGPEQVTISGSATAIDAVCRELGAAGIRSKRLDVTRAFHSSMMDPMLDDFERMASRVALRQPSIPVVSGVNGRLVEDGVLTSGYFRRQIREPVRFSDAVRAMRELGVDTFVEIGPQPTLVTMALAATPASHEAWLPSLRKGRDDWQVILETLGRMYERGADVHWARVGDPTSDRRVPLPHYAWQRKRHWFEPRAAAIAGARPAPTRRPPSIQADEATAGANEPARHESGTMRVTQRVGTREMATAGVMELLNISAETPGDASLESVGVDSLGLAILRSTLVDLPGGRELARTLNPSSRVFDVIRFADSVLTEDKAPSPVHELDGYVRRAESHWSVATPASVNKRSEGHLFLSRCARLEDPEGEVVVSEVRMHTDHPFFYERALDHVPGLYLIEAVRQQFNWRLHSTSGSLAEGGTLDRLEADFFQFVEHDEPVFAILRADDQDTYTADIVQRGCRKARITIAARRIEATEYGRCATPSADGLVDDARGRRRGGHLGDRGSDSARRTRDLDADPRGRLHRRWTDGHPP